MRRSAKCSSVKALSSCSPRVSPRRDATETTTSSNWTAGRNYGATGSWSPRGVGRGCRESGSTRSASKRMHTGSPSTRTCARRDGLWAIGDVNGLWPLTHVGKYQGEVVADNILGRPREANYEAVPRVVYTDPQAAAVGATTGRFSAMVPITEIAKIATYTRAYADDKGFFTLLSDGAAAHGRLCARPRVGRMAAAGHPGDPRPPSPRRPRRHHSAVPDVLRDLRRRAEGAPPACRRPRQNRSAPDPPTAN